MVFAMILLVTFFNLCLEASILWNFQLAVEQKLNIGVLSSVWSTMPLAIAIIEFIFQRILPGKINIFGFLALTLGSISVSFSNEAEIYLHGGN